jgi:hypothetical protein
MILHEKLVEIRKLVKALKKDMVGKVGFKDYPYISTDNILEKIMDKMNELKVLLIPTLSDCTLMEFNYVNKDGKDKTDFITQGTMGFTWINAEEPADREYVPWYFFGQQDEASKSLGSGLTYSQRYFLKMSFQIATDEDDPDQRDTSGKKSQSKQEPPKEQKEYKSDQYTIPALEKAEMLKLAKEKKVDMKVKGKEWTHKESSNFWTEKDFSKVMEELRKMEAQI